jgi:hypothetical protein
MLKSVTGTTDFLTQLEFVLFSVFESESRLTRIGCNAFSRSDLVPIELLSSMEILDDSGFVFCMTLSNFTLETESKLTRIERNRF